jgi:hypothetical protein
MAQIHHRDDELGLGESQWKENTMPKPKDKTRAKACRKLGDLRRRMVEVLTIGALDPQDAEKLSGAVATHYEHSSVIVRDTDKPHLKQVVISLPKWMDLSIRRRVWDFVSGWMACLERK